MTETITSAANSLVGLAEAAEIIGKSETHVLKLVKAGHILKAAPGKYRVADVAQGALKFREAEDRRAAKTASSSRVHDRRADEIDLRIEERRGRLVAGAQEEALGVVDECLGLLRSEFAAIAPRMSDDIQARRRIEDGFDRVLAGVAKRAAAIRTRLAADRTTTGGASAPAARRVGARKSRVSAKQRDARPA